jgi:hypothetical protein
MICQTDSMNFVGMHLDDEGWAALTGGYRIRYDPRGALRALERGTDAASAWKELWNELHHQGDVGDASYAAVPHLVRIHLARGAADWNTYALVATIEEARRAPHNPDLPPNLCEAYQLAWRQLVDIGLTELRTAEDSNLVCSILAVVSMGKGQFTLGRFAVSFTEDERREILAKADGMSLDS